MADDPVIHVEPLRPWARRGLFAAVVFFHVGAGWALTQIHPEPIIVGDQTMQVSFVSETPPQPALPPERPQEQPPEPPQLESMIQPPTPDLTPPEFPVPKPPPPKPVVQPKPPPPKQPPQQQATPAPAPPTQTAAPRPVTAEQVGYLARPNPIYPLRSRRIGESGTVNMRVLIDPSGRPSQVQLASSSGHPALDEAALSAMRAARFRPVPEPLWVNASINFVLQ
ncbi:MAG TPA: energy transducer TonB [Reyranella sp.]|jgi:protein TonB|nr:energy transducer TonB [Reyranella sp.]